jgi:hypothetical protein
MEKSKKVIETNETSFEKKNSKSRYYDIASFFFNVSDDYFHISSSLISDKLLKHMIENNISRSVSLESSKMMIRRVNLFGRESFFKVKHFSTKTAASFKPKSTDYDEAKPFEEIPGLTKFEAITRFMPGGRYHKASMTDVQKLMREEFGSLYRIPGMFGQATLLSTFDPDDIEYIFRNDGEYPYRRGLLTMKHFREKIRPDIYEVGGLVVEYD